MVVSKGADKGLEIYIENCKALDPKNIELVNPDPMNPRPVGKIWVDNCQKLDCEVKEMEFEVFNKIKHSKNLQKGKDLVMFNYKDKGTMATVGRNRAVVDLSFYKFSGYLAWFIWMFLHLMLILSVKNKIIIFINWAWNYFTKDTSLRLIFTTKNK